MPDEPAQRRSFADLYRATVQPLRRYLTRMLGDNAEAEDIAHDAFIRIRPVTEADRAEKPEALLYTTARRLALNRLKRRRIAPFATGADPESAASTAPDAAHQLMAQQRREQLTAAIAELPPGCRSVLLLCKVEQLSHRETAARLGIAVSTVEKQYARALRLLRARLADTTTDGDAPATHRPNPTGS